MGDQLSARSLIDIKKKKNIDYELGLQSKKGRIMTNYKRMD